MNQARYRKGIDTMHTTSRIGRAISPKLGLAITSAMGAVLLAGCATGSAPRADLSASKAQSALAEGKTDKAIANAEAAVEAEPRNAAYRAMLGSAYLEAGRFASASTSFNDAMALGDNSARTALSLALALSGEARYNDAVAVLNDWDDAIAPADLGLAYALAGQPQRGVQVMSQAIRAGYNTPKIRQNLAYAYALSGQWREARVMAAQDVPADQVGDRMQEWATMAQPEAWQQRVASLIGAPAGVQDAGQPVSLALANTPSVQQLAAEASAYAGREQDASELPAVSAGRSAGVAYQDYPAQSIERPDDFQAAFATLAPAGGSLAQVAQDAVRFVQEPVVQTVALRQGAALKPAYAAAAKKSDGSHLVQLGSFASEQGARRAWGIYAKRYPELAGHEMVVTEALVKGKRYWRVSAAGYGLAGAQAMCGQVKNRGNACFAYAQDRPLPGAIDTGVRMAMR
ncbi:tetratricopeptide repeat protein [Croceibacterium aestuarii]|uniref:tetratricopeptide repeat protein n=1 Tax=Croceibacterium aestuarii TaxID=3064139 RepID=UPI00272E9375|nr:tetratricopeptide repeat protein [Croceibacterium sp. D39]